MLRRMLLVSAALAAGCASAPARKDATVHCPESQQVCLQGTRCDYDTKRACTVCACVAWDDAGPRGMGAAGRAVPEGTPPTKLPPLEPGR